MTRISNNNYCLNCNATFPIGYQEEKEIFCTKCGQSNKESRLSIFKLVKDGISNVFNLDNRLIHTFRDIFYPAKLTRAYIAGKRKYYVNPARLFIFMLIGIITVSLWLAKLDNTKFGGDKMHSRAEKSVMLTKFDKLVDSLETVNNEAVSDTIRERLFKNVYKPENDTIGLNQSGNIFGKKITMKKFGISSYDAVHMSIDEILTKYKVTDFWDRQYVSTYIRISTDPANSLIYILKNLTWAVFITILLMSVFMKLLYIRGYYYIVEHAVLQLNLHSFYFVAISAIIIINTLLYSFYPDFEEGFDIGIYILILLFAGGVQFFAIKKYYKHGIFGALISQTIINSAYIMFFFLSAFFVTIISVFLY